MCWSGCAGPSTRRDAVIVSGGVSVGPYDVVKAAFEPIGQVDLWRVAVQPGKPFAFGTRRARPAAAPVLLFGLPGNPVSIVVTFELFVRPGRPAAGRPAEPAPARSIGRVLEEPVTKSRAGGHSCACSRAGRGRAPGPRRAGRVSGSGSRAGRGATCCRRSPRPMRSRSIPEAVDSLPAGAEVELRWLDRG